MEFFGSANSVVFNLILIHVVICRLCLLLCQTSFLHVLKCMQVAITGLVLLTKLLVFIAASSLTLSVLWCVAKSVYFSSCYVHLTAFSVVKSSFGCIVIISCLEDVYLQDSAVMIHN